MSFQQKPTTKKGAYAESIIDQKLKNKGWVIYKPINEDQAHAFDRLCIKDKEICMIAEVKAKAKRKYYPDTGIDFKHYEGYKLMMDKHNLDTLLFFVDEEAGLIYGNNLSKLEKPDCYEFEGKTISYPRIEIDSRGKKIIYFHIGLMITIAKLETNEIIELQRNTTKNQRYIQDDVNNCVSDDSVCSYAN